MKTIKENLKLQATEIRKKKDILSTLGISSSYMSNLQSELHYLKVDYRYQHTAYCMIRGREYKDIENKTKIGNEINMTRLNDTIYFMKQEISERTSQEELHNA